MEEEVLDMLKYIREITLKIYLRDDFFLPVVPKLEYSQLIKYIDRKISKYEV